MTAIDRLLDVMAKLRDPETGCPWDVAQDFATIAPYTIEEAYEVAEAIAEKDWPALKDELGDLLFQVVFYAQMAREDGLFDFEAIAEGVAEKMVRRHPHVFGDGTVADAEAQTDAWEAQKAAERTAKAKAKGRAVSVLDGVTSALPALTRAAKLQARAARVGFDWPVTAAVIDKIDEEIGELRAEFNLSADQERGADKDRIEDELEASWQGYRSQAVQPVWVGRAEPLYHDLITIQRDVFNGIVEAMKPGVTVGELLDVAQEAVRTASPASGPLAGCGTSLMMHGRGQGDDRPLVTNPTASSRYLDLQMQEGNVVILKPRVRTADRKHGVNWGDTVAIGPNGAARLGKRPHDIRISEA